jgi:hypothetical protein
LPSRPPPKKASGKRQRSPVQQDSRPPPKKASGKRERSPVQQDSRPPPKKASGKRQRSPVQQESDQDEASVILVCVPRDNHVPTYSHFEHYFELVNPSRLQNRIFTYLCASRNFSKLLGCVLLILYCVKNGMFWCVLGGVYYVVPYFTRLVGSAKHNNKYHLLSGMILKKYSNNRRNSRFNEENVGIKLQPNPVASRTDPSGYGIGSKGANENACPVSRARWGNCTVLYKVNREKPLPIPRKPNANSRP